MGELSLTIGYLRRVKSKDFESLFNCETAAPKFRNAVPIGGAEHFVPFFIALGAGNLEDVKMLWQEYRQGNLGYTCYQF